MNIIENISRIENGVANIKQALIEKGADILENDKIDSFADKIINLPTSGGSDTGSSIYDVTGPLMEEVLYTYMTLPDSYSDKGSLYQKVKNSFLTVGTFWNVLIVPRKYTYRQEYYNSSYSSADLLSAYGGNNWKWVIFPKEFDNVLPDGTNGPDIQSNNSKLRYIKFSSVPFLLSSCLGGRYNMKNLVIDMSGYEFVPLNLGLLAAYYNYIKCVVVSDDLYTNFRTAISSSSLPLVKYSEWDHKDGDGDDVPDFSGY